MKKVALAFVVFTLLSCTSQVDLNYVKAKLWFHENGYAIGGNEFLLFRGQDTLPQRLCELKGDTIYYMGKADATIIHTSKKHFSMTVRSLFTKEIGLYWDSDERFASAH